MKGTSRMRLVTGVALAACLSVVALGLAADRTDRSFGENGVANLGLPREAQKLDVAPVIADLAETRGKIVAALGDFSGESSYIAAARFGANGSPDPSFGDGGYAEAVGVRNGLVTGLKTAQGQAIAVQSDGKVVLVGFQEGFGGEIKAAPALVRFRADGSLDQSFGDSGVVAPRPKSAGDEALHAVTIEPDGTIVAVGGKHEHREGEPAALVIAYRPDGSIDRRFGNRGHLLFPTRRHKNLYTGFREVQALPGGKLLAAGYLRGRLFLVRFKGNGKLDRGFGGDGQVTIGISDKGGCVGDCGLDSPFVVRREGRIVVAANLSLGRSLLVGLRPGGGLDRSFGDGGFVRIGKDFFRSNGLALDAKGRLLVAGIDSREVSRRDIRIVFAALRFQPGGRIDRSFGHGGEARLVVGESSAAFAALTQPGGRVVAGGGAQTLKGGRTGHRLLMTRYLAR